MRFSFFSKRGIRSAAGNHARKVFGVIKDLHFGWFVVIPIVSSSGSVVAGLASQTGYLVVALAIFGACSFFASRVRDDTSKTVSALKRLLLKLYAKVSGIFERRVPRDENAIYIPILPERPSLVRVREEPDWIAKRRRLP